MLFEQPFL